MKKEAVKKIKPLTSLNTESQGKEQPDWRLRQESETITAYERRIYGAFEYPKESLIPLRTRGELKANSNLPDWCKSLTIDFQNEQDKENEFYTLIDTGRFHNCDCHKLACLAFFEWDGNKYVQVPLMSSDPNTKYFVLGEVSEIGSKR